MKLRINGNRLKLKLSESELSDFSMDHELSDFIDFGNGMILNYALKARQVIKPEAEFNNNTILIYFPESKIATFKNTALTGIDNHPVEKGKPKIVIEKDFPTKQQQKSDGNNINTFPNPLLIDMVD